MFRPMGLYHSLEARTPPYRCALMLIALMSNSLSRPCMFIWAACLQVDWWAAQAPATAKVRGLPDSGETN